MHASAVDGTERPATVEQALAEFQRTRDPAKVEAVLADVEAHASRAASPQLDEAAAAARHRSALASLRSVEGSLAAYRRAAELDSNDTWTWIFISRLEAGAGRLAAAEEAATAALACAAGMPRSATSISLSPHSAISRLLPAGCRTPSDISRPTTACSARWPKRIQPNHDRQRDLSVSWNKIGDVRRAQGDLAGALDAHTARHAIAEKLAAADPGNAGWQRDLSVSWERIASVAEGQGNAARAEVAWRQALAISEALAARFPDSVDLQTTPVVHLAGLARLADTSTPDGRAAARGYLERARALLEPLAAAGRLDAPRAGWIDWIGGELTALDQ